MANARFDVYAENLTGHGAHTTRVDFANDDLRMLLIDTADDDPNIATDEDLADITGAAIVATSPDLTGFANVNGLLSCDAFTFSTVTGDQSEEMVLYKHTGTPSTSILLVSYDTFASGMPVTPNGGDIDVTDPSGLFQL